MERESRTVFEENDFRFQFIQFHLPNFEAKSFYIESSYETPKMSLKNRNFEFFCNKMIKEIWLKHFLFYIILYNTSVSLIFIRRIKEKNCQQLNG